MSGKSKNLSWLYFGHFQTFIKANLFKNKKCIQWQHICISRSRNYSGKDGFRGKLLKCTLNKPVLANGWWSTIIDHATTLEPSASRHHGGQIRDRLKPIRYQTIWYRGVLGVLKWDLLRHEVTASWTANEKNCSPGI